MPVPQAPSNRSVSSLQRWQSLKTVGGCMGAFSQIFHLSRMLEGSTDHLATPDARAQNLGVRTHRYDVEKQSALQAVRTAEAETGTYLRKILDAKQEPFVLQEVIWEKRHPVRTRSSRELKFELNDMVPSSSKSQNSKRVKSKNSRRHSEAGCDGDLGAPSHSQGGASFALFKGCNVPAESMVALPSPQSSPHRRKTRPSSSIISSSGKSPNKQALLMEAAAKILEGSNRQAGKMPSSSMLREIDGSKRPQELSKLKGAPIEKASFGVEPATRHKTSLQNVTTLEQKRVESRKQHSNADKSFSFVNQSQQDLISLNSSFEMTEEEVTVVMQSRINPSDELPATRGELSQPARTADHSNVGREHRQLDRDASVDRSKNLQSVPYAHSSTMISVNELPPVQEFVNFLKWNTQPEHSQVEILNESHELLMPRKSPVDDIHCGIITAGSGDCEISIGDDDCAHAYTLVDMDSNGLSKSDKRSGYKPGNCQEMSTDATESDTTEKTLTPVLLLCNYSWWKQEQIQAYSSTLKNETLYDHAECDPPLVATRGSCVVKIFEERKEMGNLEEDSSTSSDSYVEEFQQSSPVSVLDMVYDDGQVLGKPFDYFDEARQKLLESVRCCEMLADMDLDMLIKINEDSHCHEFEEEFDSSSLKKSWGCDVTNTCATHHQVSSMASPDYYRSSRYRSLLKVEADGLGLDSACGSHYEATEDDLYIHSDEDFYMQRLWEVTDEEARSTSDFAIDVRARFKAERESALKALPDCSSEPPNLPASNGPSTRTNSLRDALGEVERLTCMLHLDITSNSWSSFHEEVEEMEMQLESSLFSALMRELLSDLQY